MKLTMYFYVDLDGRIHNCETDSEREIELTRVNYGNVFFNKAQAIEFANRPKEMPLKHLSDEEMRRLDKEQYEFGWSMLTEEEKREARERRKSLDQLQLEFGREYERRVRLGLV